MVDMEKSKGWIREKGRTLLGQALEGEAWQGRDPCPATQEVHIVGGENLEVAADWDNMSSLPLGPNYKRVLRTILMFKKYTLFFCKHESHIVLKSEPVKGCSWGNLSSFHRKSSERG